MLLNLSYLVNDAFNAVLEGHLARLEILLGASASVTSNVLPSSDPDNLSPHTLARKIEELASASEAEGNDDLLSDYRLRFNSLVVLKRAEFKNTIVTDLNIPGALNLPSAYRDHISPTYTPEELAEDILNVSVPIDAINIHGFTLLGWAIRCDQLDIADFLARAGADLDYPLSNGLTPRLMVLSKRDERWNNLTLYPAKLTERNKSLLTIERDAAAHIEKLCSNFKKPPTIMSVAGHPVLMHTPDPSLINLIAQIDAGLAEIRKNDHLGSVQNVFTPLYEKLVGLLADRPSTEIFQFIMSFKSAYDLLLWKMKALPSPIAVPNREVPIPLMAPSLVVSPS